MVRHIDGDKKNNKVENLMWVKRQQQKATKIEEAEIEYHI